MKLRISALGIGVLLFAAAGTFAEELFEDVHVLQRPKGIRGYRGAPGDFVQLKDGALLFSYMEGGAIMGMKSSDKGKTWGESCTLVPKIMPPVKGYIQSPGFLRLPNDDILLSYIYSTHPTTPYYGHNYYRRSADDGKTWTEQFCMNPYPGYCIIHNDRLHILSTGRIFAMAEYKAHLPSSSDHSGYTAMAFFSDDNGHSWQASKNNVDMYPVEVQEADAVELKDGRVLMFARTYSGYPVRAYSEDKCETWSKGEKMEGMAMPYAGLPTVRRIPSTGDLLFIWISEKSIEKIDGKDIWRRCALSTCISKDEGKTFEHQRNIAGDPKDDYGYQCIEFLGDDLALVAYHARDGVHLARIGIDWFYGK